ncbi:MAG: hypothetical protein COB37_12390 [Kordiimonadales bacterium]|nr:MAG: hypothetical protein COB37_12390 [Kordiimonadales bacterium]
MTTTKPTFKTALLGKAALLGVAILGLGACSQTSVPQLAEHETVMRNSVELVRLPLEIRSEANGEDALSSDTYAQIGTFLDSVKAGYGDVVIFDGPEASPERIAALEDFIRIRGIEYGGTSPLGKAPITGNVMLYLERYVVTTPDCNYWPDEADNQVRNNQSSFLGCTNTINLGLMVADPRDLIAGRSSLNSTRSAVDALRPATKSGTPSTPSTSGVQQGVANVNSATGGN